jgi:hypothetical protein
MVWFVKRLAILMVISLLGVGGVNYFAPPLACLQIERQDSSSKALIDAHTGYRIRLTPPSAIDKTGLLFMLSRSPDRRYAFYKQYRLDSSAAYLLTVDPALDDLQIKYRSFLDQVPLIILEGDDGWWQLDWTADSQQALAGSSEYDKFTIVRVDGSQTMLRGSNPYDFRPGLWSGDGQFIAIQTRTSSGDGIDLWEASNGYIALIYASTYDYDMDSLHLYNAQGQLRYAQQTPGEDWKDTITWSNCAPNP